MKHLLTLAAAIGLCVFTTVHAQADTYTINFNQTASSGGVSAPTGGFTYNAGTFSNFIVNYNGSAFDFTSQANAGFVNTSVASSCQFSSTFQFLSQGACAATTYQSNETASLPGNAVGDFFLFQTPLSGSAYSTGVATVF